MLPKPGPMTKFPSFQAVYGAGTAPQPHTPQTPQPPYTPNGSRFSQPTASPHYAPDMRSPPLMSPTQAPMPPQAAMPRPMSNGEMVTQPIRMVPTPQQPVIPSQFFTYEPNVLMSVHPGICLAGCVLHMFDMDRIFTDKLDLPNIVLAIRMHGGDIEFGAKAYAERAGAITHVIVESIRTQHAHLALKDRKRLVTMQWLVDVLMKKQMDVPWRHAHLPSVFVDGCRPLLGKLISFSGFDESERAAMKFMVETMGAKAGVEKVEKAREWDIPVVNYQWLADNYAGQRVEVDNQRYQLGQPCEGVSPGPYALEMINDQFKQLLLAWKMPVIVSPEQWRRSFDTKQAVENDEGVFPNKKLRAQSAPPSEAEIAAKAEERKKDGRSHPAYVVAFCGIDEENKHVLTQKLRYLGGRACEEVSECTHLVTTNGRRTEKLLEAICLGKNIVNPYWIVHGYECRQWMDTLDYFLHDEDQERHLGYNCKRSVVRARHRKVFEDVQFYITPSVEPSRAVLTKLIRLAGGTVHEDRPAPADIARCIETDAPYIVISCECDLRMVQYLLECNFPVYNTDLVLIALMRQELEPHPLYRVSTASLARPPAPQPPPGHPHFRPMPPRSVVEQPQPHRVKA
ncbi:BRCA1 protein [Ancylostoma ceylanicum]|uniref:PAX-interacting protein 1 n=1 Tax=Ancylostoma ceylanicum TaxID=53326 RepID=A0A0D6LMY6_9BILA|nr:BRCA1 protein [Ancylostoma ceylanicum]